MLLISLNCSAQIQNKVDVKDAKFLKSIKPNTRFTDNDLNKFIGTWIYANEGIELKIVLEKIVSNLGSGTKKLEIEMLNGGYIYFKNEKEIVNTLNSKPLYSTTKEPEDDLTLVITNEKTNKQTIFAVKLVDENAMKLTLSNIKGEGIKPDKDLNFLLNVKLVRAQ